MDRDNGKPRLCCWGTVVNAASGMHVDSIYLGGPSLMHGPAVGGKGTWDPRRAGRGAWLLPGFPSGPPWWRKVGKREGTGQDSEGWPRGSGAHL